jgi:hypothetical protein
MDPLTINHAKEVEVNAVIGGEGQISYLTRKLGKLIIRPFWCSLYHIFVGEFRDDHIPSLPEQLFYGPNSGFEADRIWLLYVGILRRGSTTSRGPVASLAMGHTLILH